MINLLYRAAKDAEEKQSINNSNNTDIYTDIYTNIDIDIDIDIDINIDTAIGIDIDNFESEQVELNLPEVDVEFNKFIEKNV